MQKTIPLALGLTALLSCQPYHTSSLTARSADAGVLGEACGVRVAFDRSHNTVAYSCVYPYLTSESPGSRIMPQAWRRGVRSFAYSPEIRVLSYDDFLSDVPECWLYGLADLTCLSLLTSEVVALCGVQGPSCHVAITEWDSLFAHSSRETTQE